MHDEARPRRFAGAGFVVSSGTWPVRTAEDRLWPRSRLDVDMIPANPAEGTIDVLELRATSTCEPGDAGALLDELRGPLTAVPQDDGIPDLESPDATPLFERFAEG